MASKWYDEGLKLVMNDNLDFTGSTFEVMLLQSGATFDKTDAFVDDVLTGNSEISVASYSRGTLGSKTENYDTANQEIEYDAADEDFGSLESGETVECAVIYKLVTDDSDSIPVWYCDDADDLTLNGGNVTVEWPSDGIAKIAGQ